MAKILVVDDDDDIRESLVELLIAEGYPAVGLANGKEALAALRSGEPVCVVFLDLMMPIIDGWEVLRQCDTDPLLSKVPIVVVTAAGPPAGGLGGRRILRKPFPIQRVIELTKELC